MAEPKYTLRNVTEADAVAVRAARGIPPTGELPGLSVECHVYRVDVGAVYWVSARSPVEAIGLCVLAEAGLGTREEDIPKPEWSFEISWDTIEVVRIEEEVARATSLRCEDAGDTDMWTEHMRLDGPAVLGCSEWP